MFTPNPANETDAKIIASLISECEIGSVITYEKMHVAIGREPSRHVIDKARKMACEEDGNFTVCVRGEGIGRVSPGEFSQLTRDQLPASIRRKANKANRQLAAVPYESLDDSEKSSFLVARAFAGVISHITKRKSVQKLESAASESDQLPIGKTLELFK